MVRSPLCISVGQHIRQVYTAELWTISFVPKEGMHRAEKSSSRICRDREVEKAQETHRKKIDGVKSYMCGIISKPTASRSSTSCRLRPARSVMGSFSSVTCVAGSVDTGRSEGLIITDNSETLILGDGNSSTQQNQQIDEFQQSLAKMEEFRGVAPVPGLGIAKQTSSTFAPPPVGSKKKSLNGSFRTRRLKQIKSDNADVFERIRKSVSHYRNDDLRREWQQNVSYLSSISEFPVSVDSHNHHNTVNGSRACFGPPSRRQSFLKTPTRAEPLPSIPVVVHPIKSIPTSPKKLQLNMTPAFRSLRKAMPQQPSLPPISTPHCDLNASGASDFSSHENNKLLSSARGRSACPNSLSNDDIFAEGTIGSGLPHRSSTAVAATKFIGDLHAENETSGDAKYHLLKTGRFVGGTYLVLTVFCGDGVSNPYGFDVFAYHRELKCEYKLSVTKEMTHELLDKSSSLSFAAETAAAAGTNLSMHEIARNICDHVHFALLGSDQGEMVFLTPSVERKNDQAMRFDASPNLVAFCLHQTVEIISDCSKRRLHVFASTCPPTSYPISENSNTGIMGSTGPRICFQVMESLPPSRCTSSLSMSTTHTSSALQVEVSVDELYNILFDSWCDQTRILSLDRVVIAAIQHLHIITVPSGDDVRNELIVNTYVNTLLHPCPSRPAGTTSPKRSRQQLPHSTSQLFTQPILPTVLFQTGLIWRNAYLLAEVSLDTTESSRYQQQPKRQMIRDIDCDLIVSVFNSNSGRPSYRRFSPDKVTAFLKRLEGLLSFTGKSVSDHHSFAKKLLTYLQLDVDLFGQEVIVFPALEHECHSNASDGKGNDQATTQIVETDSPEVHAPLTCKTSWEEENISEGDEGDSEVSDEDGLDKATGLGSDILPFDTDEEENREETDLCYSSYANQDEEADLDGMTENLEAVRQQDDQEETPEQDDGMSTGDIPGNEKDGSEPSTRRSWRQGRKIDGQFCLLQGSFDDAEIAVAMSIAALGQLGRLSTPAHRAN